MKRADLLRLAFGLLLLAGCGDAGPPDAQRHLEQLCNAEQLAERYLDFYWDDLRSHRPELWAEALRRCTEDCPAAVNCGPVLSVDSWYRQAPPADLPTTERSPQ